MKGTKYVYDRAANKMVECRDPNEAPHLLDLAERLEACADGLRKLDPVPGDQLRAALDRFVARQVTMTFGGRFKSGKSLLVNRLIGRDVLPVNVEAETGAPCFIRCGPEDRAEATRNGQKYSIPCTTESIRQELSLWKRRVGECTTEPAASVELCLADCPVSQGVRWVDTPGLDESSEMDAATMEVLRVTDVLIWILSSEAPLAEKEVEYIQGHIANAGSQGVVFLTNVFIRDSRTHHENWEQFLKHQMPVLCNRLKEYAAKMGFNGRVPQMLCVCVRTMGCSADEPYGAAEVRRFVRSITSPDHALVRACRLQRLAITLNEVTAAVSKSVGQIAAANRQREAALIEYSRLTQGKRSRFEREVHSCLEAFVGNFRSAANEAGRSIAGIVDEKDIKRDGTYNNRLSSALVDAFTKLEFELSRAVAASAQKNGQNCCVASLLNVLRREFSFGPTDVKVPTTSVNLLPAIGVGVVVGFLGSLITWGLAGPAFVGAAAAVGGAQVQKALKADAEGTRGSIKAEATRVAHEIASREEKVRRLIFASFQAVVQADLKLREELIPEREKEEELRILQDELQSLRNRAWKLGSRNITCKQ
jgi:predicted GTPase